jgi:hypothetical protein
MQPALHCQSTFWICDVQPLPDSFPTLHRSAVAQAGLQAAPVEQFQENHYAVVQSACRTADGGATTVSPTMPSQTLTLDTLSRIKHASSVHRMLCTKSLSTACWCSQSQNCIRTGLLSGNRWFALRELWYRCHRSTWRTSRTLGCDSRNLVRYHVSISTAVVPQLRLWHLIGWCPYGARVTAFTCVLRVNTFCLSETLLRSSKHRHFNDIDQDNVARVPVLLDCQRHRGPRACAVFCVCLAETQQRALRPDR